MRGTDSYAQVDAAPCARADVEGGRSGGREDEGEVLDPIRASGPFFFSHTHFFLLPALLIPPAHPGSSQSSHPDSDFDRALQFITADREKTIDSLPGCWDASGPKKYEPINAGGYIDMRLNATY